jgi:hypothetical protein
VRLRAPSRAGTLTAPTTQKPAAQKGPAVAAVGAAGGPLILVGNAAAAEPSSKRARAAAADGQLAAGGRRSSNFLALRSKIATELKTLIGVPVDVNQPAADMEEDPETAAANARKTEAQRQADRERVRQRRAVRERRCTLGV